MRWTRSLRLVLVAGMGLAIPTVAATPTQAQAVDRLEVEVVGGDAAFDFGEIYPGATLSSTIRASNIGDEDGRLTVSAVDVVDESRCSPAEERRAIACGSGPGNLGAQVEFSIELLRDEDDPLHLWAGKLDELVDVDLMHSTPFVAGATADYRFDAHLPSTSGNETQRDLLGFDLRFDLSGDTSSVLGSAAGSGRGTTVLGVTLPQTGAELARWGYIAGAGMLLGSVLVLLSQHGRRRHRPAV